MENLWEKKKEKINLKKKTPNKQNKTKKKKHFAFVLQE